MQSTDLYQGWTNYQTWNVALYINNEYWLYRLAKDCSTYKQFVSLMQALNNKRTPDGVSWTHKDLDTAELDELIADISATGWRSVKKRWSDE